MEKDMLSTAVSEPVILRNGSQPSIKGPDGMVYRHGPHRSCFGPYAGTCLKRLRHFRAGSPYGMAYPSSGAGSDHHGWGRQGSGRGADSGGPPWRYGLVPSIRQTLARSRPRRCHDPYFPWLKKRVGTTSSGWKKVTEEQYTGN